MVEIFARSGIRVLWNLVGRSLNSLTKSSSSSLSSQIGFISFSAGLGLVVGFEEGGGFFLSEGGDSLELGGFVVVLFLDEVGLDRSDDFLMEEVEFEDLVPELSFLMSDPFLVVLEVDLVELSLEDVVLASLVWFLVEEEEIGLMSFV